jgi:hypothetical protein
LKHNEPFSVIGRRPQTDARQQVVAVAWRYDRERLGGCVQRSGCDSLCAPLACLKSVDLSSGEFCVTPQAERAARRERSERRADPSL